MAGNVKTVTNLDNYKKIYNEGNVLFNKKTYEDLGDDLKDMFSGKDYGHTRRKRQEDKEARQKAEQIETEKMDREFYAKHPYTEYAKEVGRELGKKYGNRLDKVEVSNPIRNEFDYFPKNAGLLQSKEAIDEAGKKFEEKLKRELDIGGYANGGRVEAISKDVENALYNFKRQFGDISSWWKDKLGIKKRGGFQR